MPRSFRRIRNKFPEFLIGPEEEPRSILIPNGFAEYDCPYQNQPDKPEEVFNPTISAREIMLMRWVSFEVSRLQADPDRCDPWLWHLFSDRTNRLQYRRWQTKARRFRCRVGDPRWRRQ